MKVYRLFFIVLTVMFFQCKSTEKPNIIFILIDDLGWRDTGYMGSEYYETPHIDNLANQGMIFSNAYSNAANCAPTRASLLTGQYTPRHGVFTVASSERGKPEDRRLIPVKNSTDVSIDKTTIAEALKPAGYVSAAFGKWHIGNAPTDHGFDTGFDRDKLGYRRGHFNDAGEDMADKLTDAAIEFIMENKKNPFFLYLSHHAVHTPIEAKDSLIHYFESKDGVGCHNDPVYAAMITSVDQSVGRVYQTLKELNLDKNTMLIFFSDNGGYGPKTCMKPLRGGKGMYYEGGIRVPMFVHWPGKIMPESICDVPVISTDFYPTFLEIAGAPVPSEYPLDGVSILPLLSGAAELTRDKLFWHFPAYLESYPAMLDESRDPIFRTRPVSVIRKGDWKLLMFHEEWLLDGGSDRIDLNNSIELYNLADDLGEEDNLANDEPSKRDELLHDLLEWQRLIGAPLPVAANPEYIPTGHLKIQSDIL